MEVIPCKIIEIATPGSKTAAFGKRLGKEAGGSREYSVVGRSRADRSVTSGN